MKRSRRLLIPVTDLEHEAVTVFASRLGLSAADVVRQALAAYVPDFPMADDQRGDHWANKRLQSEYRRWLAENDDPLADESFEDFLRWKKAQGQKVEK